MPTLFGSIVIFILCVLLNLYTGFSLFSFGKLLLPSIKPLFFWPPYFLLSYGFILVILLGLEKIKILNLIVLYWVPFFVYFIGFALLFDLISLFVYLSRGIKILMPAGVGIAVMLSCIIVIFGTIHARNITSTHYELYFPQKTGVENFRIVLVSDMHIGTIIEKKWTSRIVDRINDASPDMVIFAGDIFDSGIEGVKDREGIRAEFARIQARLGVFACLGNHDTDRRIQSIDLTARFLRESGINVLSDQFIPLNLSNESIVYLIGRRDAHPIGAPGGRLSIEELIAPIPSPAMLILLDHQPMELPQAAEAGIDLVLSGHTHHGQFFPGNIFTWRIFKSYGATHYGHWQKDNTQAIITSGAGVWGAPVRIGSNSEIAVIDLRFGE